MTGTPAPDRPTPDALRELTTSLAEQARTGTHTHRAQWAWRNYRDFCEHHHLGDPGDQANLLRWLHAHYPDWAWATAHAAASYIADQSTHAGHANPHGPAVADYLSRLRRDLGQARETHKVDPLMPGDLTAIAAALAAPPAHVLAAQAVVVLGRALRAAAAATGTVAPAYLSKADTPLHHLGPDAYRVEDGAITVTVPGGLRARVDAATDPHGHRVVAAALADGGGRLNPDTAAAAHSTLHNRLTRLGVRGDRHTALDALDTDGRDWLLFQLRPDAVRTSRDLAFTAVALVGARRAADLAGLRMRDIDASDDGGYHYLLTEEKSRKISGAQGGDHPPLHGWVDHIDEACAEGDWPTPDCPACLLGRWLWVRAHLGATGDDLVFTGSRNGRDGRMTTGMAGAAMRRLWAAHPTPRAGARISSRSARVGAYTAAAATMTLPDRVELFGVHRSLRAAGTYHRTGYDPRELTLPVHPDPDATD